MKKLLLPILIASSLAVTACCDCQTRKGSAENSHAGAHGDNHEHEGEHTHDHSHENGDEHSHEHNHENGDEHNHEHNHENGDEHKADANTVVGTTIATALALGNFDWNAKASDKSSADIGDSPYFRLPEGMTLIKGADTSADQNITKVITNGNLNIYDGEKVSSNEGVLSYLDITGKDGINFDQAKFDQHVTDHMKAIGAVEFYNDTVPNDLAKQIGDLDGISNEDYMKGAFDDRKLRQFAVNHENGQLFYQVMSDDKHGEIGVLEVKGFKTVDFAPVAPAVSEGDQAKAEADEKAKAEAGEKAKAEADEKAKAEADEKAKAEADEKAKAEADEKAKAEADEKAKAEADEKAKAEADEKAKAEADEKAKAEADEKAKAEADEKAKAEADEKAKADAKAKVEAQPTASEMKEQIASDGKAILNINFNSGKDSIRTDNMPFIEQIYALLQSNPDLKISIEGHTDSSGNTYMNQALSVSRAQKVKAKLEAKGIDASRLKATGFGETKPIASNDTHANKAKNRRVELVKFK